MSASVMPRITPAHAGKRFARYAALFGMRDHPRTRGEKVTIDDYFSKRAGSPPHTRGKVRSCGRCSFLKGITPAHAGKSHLLFLLSIQQKDHPRTRGEKTPLFSVIVEVAGSPPHTRGKVTKMSIDCLKARITPAHAGKS